jgi:uncharacterized cupredoxin-like copper-binding protein
MAVMRTLVAAALGTLLVAAAPSTDWTAAQLVTVIETDYRFEPPDLTFRVAVPYRLHVENRGKELHELTAPAFFKAVELRNPEALNSDRTELVLQPGEQKDLYFIPRQAGRYAFTCADHDWAGMTGVMTIQ